MNNQELKDELGGVFVMLTGISVPIGLLQQIGIPIMNAMDRLRRCIDAIPAAAPAPAQEAPAQEAPARNPKEQPFDPNEEKALKEGDF